MASYQQDSDFLTNIVVSKVPTYDIWNTYYGISGGIGNNELVIIPPTQIQKNLALTIGAGDSGKVLTASYSNGEGSISWAAPASGLPAQSSSTGGRILQSVYNESTGTSSAEWTGTVSVINTSNNHASSENTYGQGSSTLFGHVKLSSETDLSLDVGNGVAATPKAVKTAYDEAKAKSALIINVNSGNVVENAYDYSSDCKNNLLLVQGEYTIMIANNAGTSGDEFEVMNYGTGTVVVSVGSQVYLNGVQNGSKSITQQYASAVLKCIDSSHWVIQGAIS